MQVLAGCETNSERRHVLEAMSAGLRAANPRTLVRKKVRLRERKLWVGSRAFDLSQFDRILVMGGGKASALMASEIERILEDRITEGIVNIPGYLAPTVRSKRIKFHKATHPLPTLAGARGVEAMLRIAGTPSKRDLIVCLISGGGSALMPLPLPGLKLADKREVTELLLTSGATIDEVNAVRRHLSAIKGGRLAERLYPATVISLIISDVVGDRLDAIASGLTAPDGTTYSDVRRVLRRYKLEEKVPARVRRIIEKGMSGLIPETPKPGSSVFKHVHNVIVGNNRDSCVAAAKALRRAGYQTLIMSTRLQGEARRVGSSLARTLSIRGGSRGSLGRPLGVVAGGETTVTVRGSGMGGRNQELVLSAALEIRGLREVVIGAIGTDGVDGPTGAAGALADSGTVERGLRRGLDPRLFLGNNDSYHFFDAVGGLITTGPTGTNVNDLVVGVVGKL